jgi:uncharacterized membrane protein
VGIDSFWYKAVLVVHILTAIVGLGGVTLNALYAAESRKREGAASLAVLDANFRVTLVAEKAIYVVLLAGLGLVWLSDGAWSFGGTWIWLSIVLFVVALGASHGVLIPSHRATVRELRQAGEQGRAPDGARLGALGKRQAIVGPVLHLLLVVIVVLMVWKPGS